MSAKIKVKIQANEYIDFGSRLSVAYPQEKFDLSMVSGVGAVHQPQLTLEPSHTPKKVNNISQWFTAFNTFVSIYSEKCSQDALKLMKYGKVVRDFANKSGDWIFFDEKFRYLRQSSPWDQIHWEPQLPAMTHFSAKSVSVKGSDRTTPRGRF